MCESPSLFGKLRAYRRKNVGLLKENFYKGKGFVLLHVQIMGLKVKLQLASSAIISSRLRGLR